MSQTMSCFVRSYGFEIYQIFVFIRNPLSCVSAKFEIHVLKKMETQSNLIFFRLHNVKQTIGLYSQKRTNINPGLNLD